MSDMKKRNFSTLQAAACLFLSLTAFGNLAVAAELQVPTQHSSINKALAAAVSGDTIKVAGGTYFERITMKEGVVLEGAWNEDFTRRDIATIETVIDGIKEKGPVVTCADAAVLDGFTIIHGTLLQTADISEGSGIYCNQTSPTLQNNTIKENQPSGIFCSTSTAAILDNRIHGNEQAGVYFQKGSAIKIKGNTIWNNGFSGIGSGKKPASTFEIVQNVIHDNKRSGVNVQTATGVIKNNLVYDNARAGIRCVPMPVVIVNNTVDGNAWSGIHMEDPAAVPTIKNNIVSHNKDGGIRAYGKGYDHNLVFSNGISGDCDPHLLWCVKPNFGGYEDEDNYKKKRNIIADPLYRDRANHDYHLQARSPAIDSGDRKPEFNDIHFLPSLGSERNDMGYYGGPLAKSEERVGNAPPQAIISAMEPAFVGGRVVLNGKDSIDPDGDMLTYQWELTQTPEGSAAKLRKADRVRTAFKIDKSGEYVAKLLVTDTQGVVSEPQIVEIHVPLNRAPVARIGEVISQMKAGDNLTVYGNASKDPEGAQISYHWSLLFKPAASQASLTVNGDSSSFLFDVDGSYTVQLIVSDGELDSEPATVNISTRKPVTAGIRRVPEEYPTIQAALDAATPGDDIIVQEGRYEELLVVEKSVNLIGKNWPIIDGGRQEGNKNTLAIFYLGDRAGKVTGFVITGGGRGTMGHGINIWDSSPDVYNNRITGNNHGIGIHGSPALSSKTKVHANLIYKNDVGIGNGKDSVAQIYNNRVYENRVVGIGTRGKARPKIRNNYIYKNHLGIGGRETASPLIEGNHIFNNFAGITISPLSNVKSFAYDDIIIKNNLIVRNHHLGVNITCFNLSNVFITNNTIDSNNLGKIKIRSGGLIFGYPLPAQFTAVVENNIISNNQVGGLVNYIGPDLFQEPGAIVKNKHNNLWNNTVNYLETMAGASALSVAPAFDGNGNDNIESYFSAAVNQGATDLGYRYKKEDFAELPEELAVVPDEPADAAAESASLADEL